MNCGNLVLRDIICPLASLEIGMIVEGMLVQNPDPSGPRYADPPPILRHWQLVLKYFRY